MNYTNENDVATEKSGKVETNLNFIAPEGLITAKQGITLTEAKVKMSYYQFLVKVQQEY